MGSNHCVINAVLVGVVVVLLLGKVEAKPASIATSSIAEQLPTSSESSFDCHSPDLTVDQLKVVANSVSCSENKDREFWESACNCVVSKMPEAECIKCRTARNAEQSSSNNSGDVRPPTTAFPSTSPRSTTEDNETMSKKLRPNSTSTVSNSANFIRFGK